MSSLQPSQNLADAHDTDQINTTGDDSERRRHQASCIDHSLVFRIVQEHQLAHFGSAVFLQPEPEVDITPFPDDYSVYSSESAASGTSTEDLDSDSPESHALELSLADESDVSSNPTAPVPPRKGKWRVKSLFRRAITNIIQIIKGHKFSAKL